jgi:hypothetical protein
MNGRRTSIDEGPIRMEQPNIPSSNEERGVADARDAIANDNIGITVERTFLADRGWTLSNGSDGVVNGKTPSSGHETGVAFENTGSANGASGGAALAEVHSTAKQDARGTEPVWRMIKVDERRLASDESVAKARS